MHPRRGRRGARRQSKRIRRRRRCCRSSTICRPFRAAATSEAGCRPGSHARGYSEVWRKLIGRRDASRREPPEIAWLRAYSNYLTPKLGLFSADTWTAVALYIRNLVLNWLVILPALHACCCSPSRRSRLSASGLRPVVISFGRPVIVAFVLLGVDPADVRAEVCLAEPPKRLPRPASVELRKPHRRKPGTRCAYRNEMAHVAEGADEAAFLRRCLLAALAASYLLSLYLVVRGPSLADWSLAPDGVVTMLAGAGIYALAWIWPGRPASIATTANGKPASVYWLRDFFPGRRRRRVWRADRRGRLHPGQYDLWFRDRKRQ